MIRRLLPAAVVLMALLASPSAFGEPGIVVTHSGAQYEGDVVERGNDVVIKISGVDTIVDRRNVASITYTGSFQDQFQRRQQALEPDDVQGRIELAQWAMKERQYTAARDALDAALAIDPNNQEAARLLNLVQSQIRVQLKASIRPAETRNGVRDQPGGVTAGAVSPRQLLSSEDIQAIRRAEWSPEDNARLRIDTAAAKEFAQAQNVPWKEFANLRPAEQARRMLQLGTKEQQQGVQILSDPSVIAQFRRQVLPIALTGCASSACHGGPAGGSFRLVNPADTEAEIYTNFYQIMTWSQKLETPQPSGTIFGGEAEMRMVQRGQPERSLLLHYGMPADVAEFDHPKVRNYNPVFQTMNDSRARPVADWIRSLQPMPTEYPVSFSLQKNTGDEPAPAPQTQPSD